MEHWMQPKSLESVVMLPSRSKSQETAPSRDDFANYKALLARAAEVFGDGKRASLWLSTPSEDLGGEVPLKVAAQDHYSLARFEPIFVRLEHGVDF